MIPRELCSDRRTYGQDRGVHQWCLGGRVRICSDRDGLSMLLYNEAEGAVYQNADGPT